MSEDNGAIAFSRGPTYPVKWGPWSLVCRRQNARAYNAWTPTLNSWLDELNRAAAEEQRIEALPEDERDGVFRLHAWPDDLVDAACKILDAVVVEVDGRALNGTPISERLQPIETGDMLIAVWKGSRLTEAERGKSEPPSQ